MPLCKMRLSFSAMDLAAPGAVAATEGGHGALFPFHTQIPFTDCLRESKVRYSFK